MTDLPDSPTPGDDDPVLAAAGARLRRGAGSISPSTVEAAVLRRRAGRLRVLTGASLIVVLVLGGLLVTDRSSHTRSQASSGRSVEQLIASLGPQPIDPTKVKLVSSVSTFPSCDALIGDLRKVGAAHVGSQGFGGYGSDMRFMTVGAAIKSADGVVPQPGYASASERSPAASDQTTLGTNVQVAGVDELDSVKAEGKLIYDLDGKGNLRISDATSLQTLATLDVTPKGPDTSTGERFGPYPPGGPATAGELLVDHGRVVVFGTETETSKPVKGDPSATQSTTSYLTLTFVDATDPAKPTITDRVRVEGSLVSARLVEGQVRLVTTSNMADLGFVMPTTPNSVPKALEQNRRSVATSSAADWIPDWQRTGGKPTPLVPCTRVHVPDTFSGVAMTSMVTFPVGTGRFAPEGTAILAPGDTLYAGLDKVAISSEVWVDPIDQQRLKFKNWQTAIHEFTFDGDKAPDYQGSGIVDGSTIGQFAFGEIGGSLGVVTTKGTPWDQNPKVGVDLTVLTPDRRGGLTTTAKVADLSAGKGTVSAVRFVDGRVLVSTGAIGQRLDVIDVSNPAKPRRAGGLSLQESVGYFHPLADHQALIVGSRSDQVGTQEHPRSRPWVRAELLDVSSADAPRIVSTWEQPWAMDSVGSDHHAFTYWPARKLAMWGLQNANFPSAANPNHAVVLGTDGALGQVALPAASQPPAVPAPCPTIDVTDPEARQMLGPDGLVLGCPDTHRTSVDWPRYVCNHIDNGLIARYAPDQQGKASFFQCSPAPQPTVARVLVVAGRPILFTDQTLEALDPETFQSTAIAYHLTSWGFGY
jgi:hypothetical protein